MASFASLGAPPIVAEALAAMGYAEPTPVQAAALPLLVRGGSALVEAETGSGKTAAFGVACVVAGSRGRGVRALVLVPTRELARQVAEEVRAIGTGSPFRAVAVTGGVREEQEDRTLGGDVRCVVATPGRLLALLETRDIDLRHVELVVVDEADRMLDMGFLPDVENVLDATASRTQTVLVSATLPADVVALGKRHLGEHQHIRVGSRAVPQQLAHHRLNVFASQKDVAVLALLKQEDPERAIVFVRTRDKAAALWRYLKKEGVLVDRLEGEMTHEQRRHVFDLFSRGITRVLVATDLASRGLDVPEMQLVVNADLPDEDETYFHRAGRAARMGRPGKVVTFVMPNEKERRLELERLAGNEFAPYRLDLPPDAPSPSAPAPPVPSRRRPPKRKTPKRDSTSSRRGGHRRT